VSLANGYILPQGCTAGQVPKSGGAGNWLCAADNAGGGATNAFVQGGNAFGVPGVIGTIDGQNMKIVSGGKDFRATIVGKQHGLRITQSTGPGFTVDISPNVINGHEQNAITTLPSAGVTIAGGGSSFNPNTASGVFATVSGGNYNTAAAYASAGGGEFNRATGDNSAIGGGLNNLASTFGATVAGGSSNEASGSYATVPGGVGNKATAAFSFAAGRRAIANSVGSFVWADSIDANFSSDSTPNSFNVRASGGTFFYTRPVSGSAELGFYLENQRAGFINNNVQFFNTNGLSASIANGSGSFDGTLTAGGALTAGGTLTANGLVSLNNAIVANAGVNITGPLPGTNCYIRMLSLCLTNTGFWQSISDRAQKTDIAALNTRSMLEKLLALPVTKWRYVADESRTNRIGPMAQDFKRIFNLGTDDKTISMQDVSGVALAAIQGLNQKLVEQIKAKDTEIAALKATYDADIAAIKRRLGM
jgi:trimeric autotransporter adhesin